MLRERLCSTLTPALDFDTIFQHEKRMLKRQKEKPLGKTLAVGKELSEELHVILNISNIRSGIKNIDISKKYLLNCEYRRYRLFW